MTPEQTAATGAAIAAAVLELTGITMHMFVWALVGASLMQAYSDQEISRARTIVQVICSFVAGAGIAAGLAEYLSVHGMHVVNMIALVFGSCAHKALQFVWEKAQEKLNAS